MGPRVANLAAVLLALLAAHTLAAAECSFPAKRCRQIDVKRLHKVLKAEIVRSPRLEGSLEIQLRSGETVAGTMDAVNEDAVVLQGRSIPYAECRRVAIIWRKSKVVKTMSALGIGFAGALAAMAQSGGENGPMLAGAAAGAFIGIRYTGRAGRQDYEIVP
jgi:hypothetical protein